MNGEITRITPCPTCKTPIHWSEEYPNRPFCSERCKLIDLGAWFEESYRVESDEQLSPPPNTEKPD
ncbi:MAG: DNA gyrase inhibitor YacG [Gammaproteobacteria bacterium]|nr:DNA gyrase inhibitor YacG [Gammaproteobacteria bacterium]